MVEGVKCLLRPICAIPLKKKGKPIHPSARADDAIFLFNFPNVCVRDIFICLPNSPTYSTPLKMKKRKTRNQLSDNLHFIFV
jgi:hypothetical protein